jgi:transketolase
MAAPAYALWSRFLHHNPRNPAWPNRDRFILSAGHGSMLLYALLHLTGYDLTLDDLKNFRQWGSKTPGHPEYGHVPGVEMTTGPLGQGVATAVGMAVAQRYLNHVLAPEESPLLDYRIYAVLGDGCMMEGVAAEAFSLAGHLGLGSLIFLYDNNHVTIEGSTELAFSEDVAGRFAAYNWHVERVGDGNDVEAVSAAIRSAQAETGRPSLIMVSTQIGFGSPNKANSCEVHGAPLGDAEVTCSKAHLGWPLAPSFHVPVEVAAHLRQAIERGAKSEAEWQQKLDSWLAAHPDQASLWQRLVEGKLPVGWEKALPDFAGTDKIATRAASGKIINALAPVIPELVGGSADLAPSNNTAIKGAADFLPFRPGRNLRFGVREHAMAAALNGMALSNMLIPYGGTFLVFSDYLKPAVRLSSLIGKRVIYILTHDSIGVGEDGPTHQPIEQVAALRATPNTIVLRPADALETVAAWRVAIEHRTGPVALILSRQNLPVLSRQKYPGAGQAEKGAYILSEAKSKAALQLIIIATGSEVALALAAQERLWELDLDSRVVSMPSWELFEQQPESYRQTVLPPAVRARLAVEALAGFGWERYVGLEGEIVAMTSFGASAPGNVLMEKFGFTVENVVQKAKKLLS